MTQNGVMPLQQKTLPPIALLQDIGEAMFGSDWHAPFAGSANWDSHNLRAAIRGHRPVPGRIWKSLPNMMKQQEKMLIARSNRLRVLQDEVVKWVVGC